MKDYLIIITIEKWYKSKNRKNECNMTVKNYES